MLIEWAGARIEHDTAPNPENLDFDSGAARIPRCKGAAQESSNVLAASAMESGALHSRRSARAACERAA